MYGHEYGRERERARVFLASLPQQCEICGAAPVRVDHVHEPGKSWDTGFVRGSLCNACNIAMRILDEHFDAAMAYHSKPVSDVRYRAWR